MQVVLTVYHSLRGTSFSSRVIANQSSLQKPPRIFGIPGMASNMAVPTFSTSPHMTSNRTSTSFDVVIQTGYPALEIVMTCIHLILHHNLFSFFICGDVWCEYHRSSTQSTRGCRAVSLYHQHSLVSDVEEVVTCLVSSPLREAAESSYPAIDLKAFSVVETVRIFDSYRCISFLRKPNLLRNSCDWRLTHTVHKDWYAYMRDLWIGYSLHNQQYRLYSEHIYKHKNKTRKNTFVSKE